MAGTICGYAIQAPPADKPLTQYEPPSNAVLRTKYLLQGGQEDGPLMAACAGALPITLSTDAGLLLHDNRKLRCLQVWYGAAAEAEIKQQLACYALRHVNQPLAIELPDSMRTQYYYKPAASEEAQVLVARVRTSCLADMYTIRSMSPLFVYPQSNYDVVRVFVGPAARAEVRKLLHAARPPLTAPRITYPVIYSGANAPATVPVTVPVTASPTPATTAAPSTASVTVPMTAPAPPTPAAASTTLAAASTTPPAAASPTPAATAASTTLAAANTSMWATTAKLSGRVWVITARRGSQCKMMAVPPHLYTDYLVYYANPNCIADMLCATKVSASLLARNVVIGSAVGEGHVCLQYGTSNDSLLASGEAARQMLYSMTEAAEAAVAIQAPAAVDCPEEDVVPAVVVPGAAPAAVAPNVAAPAVDCPEENVVPAVVVSDAAPDANPALALAAAVDTKYNLSLDVVPPAVAAPAVVPVVAAPAVAPGVPSKQVPAAVPTAAVPTAAVPTAAVPVPAVPVSAVSVSAVPAAAAVSTAAMKAMDRAEVCAWVKSYVDAEDAMLLYLQKVTGRTLVHATKQDWRDMGLRDGAIVDLMYAVRTSTKK